MEVIVKIYLFCFKIDEIIKKKRKSFDRERLIS